MAIRYRDCLFVFAFCFTSISCKDLDLLCHQFMTLVVSGVEQHGILAVNQHTYEKEYYERFNSTHYRVCICTKTSCLRKCCPPRQVFLNNTCKALDLDIKPPIYNEELTLIANYGISNFHRIYGDTCKHKSFQLEPEVYPSDEHYLLINGTLFLPNENSAYEADQFCFENVVTNVGHDGQPTTQMLRAFICFPETPESPEEMIVYPIGMIISMPFLLTTFIVYSLPELRNLHGKNLMSEVASLLTAYIALVITQLGGHIISDAVCVFLGYLTQYAFLATFFWLNVMCFDIWSAFSGFGKITGNSKEKERKRFFLYSCYAWGCTTIILLVTLSIDMAPHLPDFFIRPNIGTKKCYFETKMATLAYFYAPMGIILICDIILFVLTAIKIYKVQRETKVLTQSESRRNDEASKQRYNLYLKLFLVMGLNWVMEIISGIFEGPKELWYVTDVMNSLQGLFIFWIFVCSRKIKKVLKTKFCPSLVGTMETNTSSYKLSSSPVSSSAPGQSIQMNNTGYKTTLN